MVLLDTNVLSETMRAKPERRVRTFLETLPDPLISVITVQELTFGCERARDPARRSKLLAWIEVLRREFDGRVLDVDWSIAQNAARLRAKAADRGLAHDPMDALIAASALAAGAVVATRNTRDFVGFGVDIINPWSES